MILDWKGYFLELSKKQLLIVLLDEVSDFMRQMLFALIITFTLQFAVQTWFVLPAFAADEIRIVTEELPPYNMTQGGRLTGMSTEVVQAVLKEVGVPASIQSMPWARAYDMAQQEKNVLIYLIARTPEREPLFKWVGEIMRIDYHFYKLRERKDIVVPDLQSAKNYSVGVLREDVRHQYLRSEPGFHQTGHFGTEH